MKRRLRTLSIATVVLCAGCPKPQPSAEADAGRSPAAPASAPLASASVPPSPPATGAFEGMLEMLLEDPKRGESHELAFAIRGARVRFASPNDVRGMPAIGIFDTAQRKTTVLIEGQKAFMVLDQGAPAADDTAWTTTKTGKRATIAGYDCELWEAKSGARKSTACVAQGIPYFDVRQIAGTGGTGGWAAALRAAPSFPLRFSEYDERGLLVARLETTKIDRRSLAPGEFEVPAGFKEVPAAPGNAGHRPDLPR